VASLQRILDELPREEPAFADLCPADEVERAFLVAGKARM
jgi:hypothetical protein